MKKSIAHSFSLARAIQALLNKLGKLNMPGAEAESYRK